MRPLELAINVVIDDRYTLKAHLGTGASGAVWRAHDGLMDDIVCLKFLHDSRDRLGDKIERFKRELSLMRRVAAPGICRAFDLREVSGHLYIVMEHVEGTLLDDVLDDARDLDDKLEVVAQIADALAPAHAEGVVHRDLKPANIIMSHDRPVVLDFGIACAPDHDRLTQKGFIVGTLPFMAPEIVAGSTPVPAADVWGIGVILYRFVVGELPFKGKVAGEVASAILGGRWCDERITALSPRLQRLFTEIFEVEPRARIPDARALAERLREAKHDDEYAITTQRLAIRPPSRAAPFVKLAAAAASIAMLGFGALGLAASEGELEPPVAVEIEPAHTPSAKVAPAVTAFEPLVIASVDPVVPSAGKKSTKKVRRKKRSSRARTTMVKELQNRRLGIADVPAARAHARAGRYAEAASSVRATKVDKALIEKKLLRFNARFDRAPEATKDALADQAERAFALVDRGEHTAANAALQSMIEQIARARSNK